MDAPVARPLEAASPSLALLEARRARDALKVLLQRELAAMADFLLALADFDKRRGWEPLGHASLFAFLVADLRLSKSAAYYRRSAAELLQAFPELIEPLRDGQLCLSTIGELAKVLTEENRAAVRRAVGHRDAGRCCWPLDEGGVCGSTHRLELDHVIPWAGWGPSTIENLRVVCGRHSALAARRAFGSRCVDRYNTPAS